MNDAWAEARRQLLNMMDADELQKAAVIFLVDGGENEEAEVLRKCRLEYGGIPRIQGTESQVDITLRCARAVMEKIEDRKTAAWDEEPKVKGRLREAIKASLPSGYGIASLEPRIGYNFGAGDANGGKQTGEADPLEDAAPSTWPGAGVTEGMPPEELRNAGLGLLMLFAQAYYRLLEAAVSVPGAEPVLDLKLNHAYLTTVRNLRNLLGKHPDLGDFPQKFEPALANLCPESVRNADWRKAVGPAAERFLSAVQEYTMEKGMYEPEEKTPAWILIALLRPVVDGAIETAGGYMERMLRERHERLAVAASGGETAGTDGSESCGSAVRQAASDFVRGRLRCGPEFKDVWVGDRHYDLRERTQARRCIAYLVESGAFDAGSARNLDEEIDPFVGAGRRQSRLTRVKIHDYFNSQNGELQELREALIESVGRSRRYFLKVE
jgi:hypothetical protein